MNSDGAASRGVAIAKHSNTIKIWAVAWRLLFSLSPMQKSLTKSGLAETSPFFDLLAEAEEIKIREVSEDKPKGAAALAGELLSTPDDSRTFLVRIKSKPAPPPAVEPGNEKADPQNRTYLLKSAELLLVDADYVLARNIYSYLLKLNIRDTEAMQGLGLCFMRLGDTVSARKCFKALHELSSGEQSFLWLGQCFVLENNDAAAIDQFSRISQPQLLSKTDQFELYKELGNCETRKGHLDQAWSFYHKALEIQPSSDVIHVNLGTLEMQRNHPDIALSYFKMALQFNARNSRAHCGMGLAAVAKQDKTLARQHFLTALDLDSQNILAIFQLASLLAPGEKADDVKSRVAQYLLKDPKHAEVKYLQAVLLFREGNWVASEKEAEAVLALDPNHAKAKTLRDQLKSNKHQVK